MSERRTNTPARHTCADCYYARPNMRHVNHLGRTHTYTEYTCLISGRHVPSLRSACYYFRLRSPAPVPP